MFASGGSVLASLMPLPEKYRGSINLRRKYFQERYPVSDIDLFLYGLNEDQAENKLLEIYEAVSSANPHKVVCFRTSNALTLVSQYPFRHIQVVLRLYSSPYFQ